MKGIGSKNNLVQIAYSDDYGGMLEYEDEEVFFKKDSQGKVVRYLGKKVNEFREESEGYLDSVFPNRKIIQLCEENKADAFCLVQRRTWGNKPRDYTTYTLKLYKRE